VVAGRLSSDDCLRDFLNHCKARLPLTFGIVFSFEHGGREARKGPARLIFRYACQVGGESPGAATEHEVLGYFERAYPATLVDDNEFAQILGEAPSRPPQLLL